MKHPDSRLLSAYLDADLPPSQLREMENHLSGCPSCRTLYLELKEVQHRARNLPDQYPDRDLWPEIARVIEEGQSPEAEVIELHPWMRQETERKRNRGFKVSYLQTAAAAVALALFSGAAGAFLAGSESFPGSTPVAPPNPWVQMVERGSPELVSSAREVVRLEEYLAQHRDGLDPVTVRILEKNLGVIDQAIRESVRALQSDPGNRFLEGHLARAVETKVNYLREATAFVAPMS